jgi:hypothetical protein
MEVVLREFELILTFIPLLAFIGAGLMELRSGISRTEKMRNCIPIVLGLVAFGISFDPLALPRVTPSSSVTLSHAMTIFCAALACSGVFITYSRKSSAILVACAGVILAYVWMLNYVVV